MVLQSFPAVTSMIGTDTLLMPGVVIALCFHMEIQHVKLK